MEGGKDEKKEKNPCSLCANLRRGALCNTALKFNCTKLALGHNMDDANETLIMNLIFNSKITCFEPVTTYSDINISLIRPLIFASESQTGAFARKYNIPVIKKSCPNDGMSRREDIKKLIEEASKLNPRVRTNIFSAISHMNIYTQYEQEKE